MDPILSNKSTAKLCITGQKYEQEEYDSKWFTVYTASVAALTMMQ